MIQLLSLGASVTAFALLAFSALGAVGIISDRTLDLYGRTILLGQGLDAFRALDHGDLLSLLLSRLVQIVSPPAQTPYAAIVASLVYGVFAMVLIGGMRRAGRTFVDAVLLSLILLANPLIVTALLEGPSAILFAIALFLLGLSMFVLHRDGSTTALMATGLSLAFLASVGNAGVAYAMAALPLIAVVCPRSLLQISAFRLGVTVVFPLFCTVLGLLFIDWVFKFGIGAAPAALSSPRGFANLSMDGGVALSTVLCLLSIVILAYLRWRPRLVLLTPMFALVATIFFGGLLLVLLPEPGTAGAGRTLAPILASVVVASAVVLVRWPEESFSRPMVYVLLLVQLTLCWVVFGLPRPTETARDDLALGRFLAGRTGVLFDAANAPSVLAARGYVGGLVLPDREATRYPPPSARDYSFVVTPDPETARGAADRVNHRSPTLFSAGATGMQLVFAQGPWRVYRREVSP